MADLSKKFIRRRRGQDIRIIYRENLVPTIGRLFQELRGYGSIGFSFKFLLGKEENLMASFIARNCRKLLCYFFLCRLKIAAFTSDPSEIATKLLDSHIKGHSKLKRANICNRNYAITSLIPLSNLAYCVRYPQQIHAVCV